MKAPPCAPPAATTLFYRLMHALWRPLPGAHAGLWSNVELVARLVLAGLQVGPGRGREAEVIESIASFAVARGSGCEMCVLGPGGAAGGTRAVNGSTKQYRYVSTPKHQELCIG